MPIALHADRSHMALVHGGQLPWLRSPQAGVERRVLERVGDEVALVVPVGKERSVDARLPFGRELLGMLPGAFRAQPALARERLVRARYP